MHTDSRIKRLVSVTVAAMALAAGAVATAPQASAATFSALADSYVSASSPTTNYGTRTTFRVDNSPVTTSYLRFNVTGVGPVSSAVLRVRASSNSSTGIQVRQVANTTWQENTITANNAPPVGNVIATVTNIQSGVWYEINVSSVVTGDGPVSFGLTTTSNTAISFSSKEGGNAPQLIAPAPAGASEYQVSRVGQTSTYTAVSDVGDTFTGSAKTVIEAAVADLDAGGGGDVVFAAGMFEFGTTHLELSDVHNVHFRGQGIDVTTLHNSTSAADDTEVFDFSGAFGIWISDMTVAAGGPARTTSDALDFDEGNNVLVERVRVSESRGRGIVFDGKNSGWSSLNNTVRDCVIDGSVPSDGIELLASSSNLIEGCHITNVGGHGIQVTKSSTSADQPNKKSNSNTVRNNVIDQAGQDGINVQASDNNVVTGNTVTNSSDNTSGRDGIRVAPLDSVTCNDNRVESNTSTDNQAVKTQRYGVNITGALCNRTVVSGNILTGNLTQPFRDLGSGTIFIP